MEEIKRLIIAMQKSDRSASPPANWQPGGRRDHPPPGSAASAKDGWRRKKRAKYAWKVHVSAQGQLSLSLFRKKTPPPKAVFFFMTTAFNSRLNFYSKGAIL
jgi:hypothetical protein